MNSKNILIVLPSMTMTEEIHQVNLDHRHLSICLDREQRHLLNHLSAPSNIKTETTEH
jgi:hypothetical protein